MESSLDQYPSAWRPLTPRGVGAFAHASFGRVFLVQFVISLLVAGAVVWFLSVAWFPMVTASIGRLPQRGNVSSGRLDWLGDSPQLLAENRFLAFSVDLQHAAQARSPAHIQIEFGLTDVRLYSLFGCLLIPYPQETLLAFNYQELKPWWGARAAVLLALAAAGTVLGLMLAWTTLATLYCLPVWLVGLYGNRQLTLCGSWRVAGAALMPGALVMTAGIVCYGLGQLDVVRLIAAFILHIVLGWTYLVLGALATPRISSVLDPKGNPFKTESTIFDPSKSNPSPAKESNPVSPRDD
jgi:hypothetical protein